MSYPRAASNPNSPVTSPDPQILFQQLRGAGNGSEHLWNIAPVTYTCAHARSVQTVFVTLKLGLAAPEPRLVQGAAGRSRGGWQGGSRTRSTFPSPQPRWPRPRSAHLGNAACWPARPVAAPVPGHARCGALTPLRRPAAAELCQVCEELARTGRGHGEPPPPPARDSEPAPRPGRAGLLRRRAWRSPCGGHSASSESGAVPGCSGCTRTPWRPRSPRDARRPASSWSPAWSGGRGGPGHAPSS